MSDDNKCKTSVWEVVIGILFIVIFIFMVYILELRDQIGNLQVQLDKSTGIVEELNPCPICGHEVKISIVKDSYYIECDNGYGEYGCGLETGFYDSRSELIKQWNSIK